MKLFKVVQQVFLRMCIVFAGTLLEKRVGGLPLYIEVEQAEKFLATWKGSTIHAEYTQRWTISLR